MDNRLAALAHTIVHHSVYLKEGENVLIHVAGQEAYPLTEQIMREAYAAGANPFVDIQDQRLQRIMMLSFNGDQAKVCAEFEAFRMNKMDAFINIKAPENIQELSDVPPDKQALYSEAAAPVAAKKAGNVKWTSLKYPTPFMAQMAGMSTEAFEDFYYRACLLDYRQMKADMEPLRELMDRTDRVRILGPGTDITFSIKGICAASCAGNYNLPDGEVATAPVRDSVCGRISYNVPSTYNGYTFENVTLKFDRGQIVRAEANDTVRLNEILDTDEGARYTGEFALGVNCMISRPINDILFDEKISGSFHFTPGQCYEDPHNGNDSAIHWDLICIQTAPYGGGEIYFDDILIQKDGFFLPDSLKQLNPSKTQ